MSKQIRGALRRINYFQEVRDDLGDIEFTAETVTNADAYEDGTIQIIGKHYGPGPHKGTGTPQEVHGNGGISAGVSDENLRKARQLGYAALEKGFQVPANDPDMMAMLEGMAVGEGGADLMKEWQAGFTEANLAQPNLPRPYTILPDETTQELYGKGARKAISTDVETEDEIIDALKNLSRDEGGAWTYSLLRFKRKITYIKFDNPSSVPDYFHDITQDTIGYQGEIRGFTEAAKERERRRGLTSQSVTTRGGPGSGHWGHRGTPGKKGGSLPRSKGTHLGGMGVPDFSDNAKKTYVSQRTATVDGETVVALVHLRRMEVFKLKPYRMESRWFVRDRRGPASEAQIEVGLELLKNLEQDTKNILEIQGWTKAEQGNNLYLAPWGAGSMKNIRLVQRPGAVERGGPGSGHFDHAGRPGEVGGSQPSGAARPTGGVKGGTRLPPGVEAVKPLGQEEELTFARMQALLDEPTQRSDDGIFGTAYTEEKWVALAEEIIDGLPEDVQQRMADIEEMIRNGKQSIEEHTDPETGEFTPEREALHRRIINQIMDEAGEQPEREEGQPPIFWATGGLPGSGKSTVMNARGETFNEGTVRIDSDRIKTMLPEYEGWNAGLLHEESSHIVGELMRMAHEQQRDIAYDATLKTTAKAQDLINEVRSAGYSPRVIYVDVPMAMAMERTVNRFLNQGGRYVPLQYIATHDAKNIKTLSTLRDEVDYWEHWDNSQGYGEMPTLLASGGVND